MVHTADQVGLLPTGDVYAIQTVKQTGLAGLSRTVCRGYHKHLGDRAMVGISCIHLDPEEDLAISEPHTTEEEAVGVRLWGP